VEKWSNRESARTGRNKSGLRATSTVDVEATGGNDAMYMRIVRQGRAPGMQNQHHADLTR